ncbi:MAG: GNAT family N-acetyltransferase [Corynebacteriales bacterium]|nr:GNAT family N-acetyltransferase [Mycobacteriales bacterium]
MHATPITAHQAQGRAVQESTANLLRCWIRETGVPEPKGGVLTLSLAGTAVVVPIEYWSATGVHKFGMPRTPAGEDISPVDLGYAMAREYLGSEGTDAAIADFADRVHNSTMNYLKMYTHRAANPGLHNRTSLFTAGEQSLFPGHPFHPTPKAREGLNDDQLSKFLPEFGQEFQLEWFAVRNDSVETPDQDGTTQQTLANLAGHHALKELRRLGIEDVENFHLLPVHPLEAETLAERYNENPDIIRLGKHGGNWRATSSTRTVENGSIQLKLSLPSIKITNSVRGQGQQELRRGAAMAKIWETVRDRIQRQHKGFDVVKDPSYVALKRPQREHDAQQNPIGISTGFEVSIRDMPQDQEHTIVLAGLLSEQPGIAGAQSRIASIITQIAEQENISVAEAGARWFDAYIDKAITPMLDMFDEIGIGVEAHAQNTLVRLDEQGWPKGAYYRDNQGFYFSQERRADDVDYGTLLPDKTISTHLAYYIGMNNVMGTIGALGSQGLADEQELLAAFREKLLQRPKQHITAELLAPHFECKANLGTTVHQMDELVGPVEAQSKYVRIPNPIAAAQPTKWRARRKFAAPLGSETHGVSSRGGMDRTQTLRFRAATVVDARLVHGWMKDTVTNTYWNMGDQTVENIGEYLRDRIASDYSTPLILEVDGRAAGYFEAYRPAREPELAKAAAATDKPLDEHDAGIHLLLDKKFRRQGVARTGLAMLSSALFTQNPDITRVIAEPDIRNAPSIRAFQAAGFSQEALLTDLPDNGTPKTAALMTRPRNPERPTVRPAMA